MLLLQGADVFEAKLNIEVQYASEQAIAAVERCGGRITTKFYSADCVQAMIAPEEFFMKGIPIPRNKIPPHDAMEYYKNPQNRGYLADPEQVEQHRFELAQKYGYALSNVDSDEYSDVLKMSKRPEQIWFGLDPGWVVNLQDKNVLKPVSAVAKEYYEAKHLFDGKEEALLEADQRVHREYMNKNTGTKVSAGQRETEV